MLKGSYRTPDGRAQLDWELGDSDNGPVFSCCGEYDGSVGQCVGQIADAYPTDARVQAIAAVWRKYHLNDLRNGLPVQEAAVQAWLAKGNQLSYDYKAACDMLARCGLLEVPIPEWTKARGSFEQGTKPGFHRYGTRWIYLPIPEDVLAEIRSWSTAQVAPLHVDRAGKFLRRNGLKLRCTLSDSKPPSWDANHTGHHYRVTISGKGRRITFDFWGSVADAESHKAPTSYDVLACISSDIGTPDTIEEFCNEFGYDQDDRATVQTYRRADRFAVRLRSFFTEAEQVELAEIR